MKYVGSKNRISSELLKVISPHIEDVYVEPFVGGANMIDKISCKTRIGGDTNQYLIAMWQALQQGWIPPKTISNEEYDKVKNNRNSYSDYYVGLVGFCATYGSKWFGGYARGFKADGVTLRDLPNEGIRNVLKQLPRVQDVSFILADYTSLTYPKGAVIYCDPPYANTTKYKDTFNSEEFWGWCRDMSKDYLLFISEYAAPEDFKCVWSKQSTTQLATNVHLGRMEKLYTYV